MKATTLHLSLKDLKHSGHMSAVGTQSVFFHLKGAVSQKSRETKGVPEPLEL